MATVVTHTPEHVPTRPAFLDGHPKRMLINGQWVEAASGKTFDSINPFTGETLAAIAESLY
jgi:aldehyde dehydrogenase (NAD+)